MHRQNEEKTVSIVASTTSYSTVMKARKNTKEVVTVHRECARERRGVRAKRFFQPIHNQLVSSIEQVLCGGLRMYWWTRERARACLLTCECAYVCACVREYVFAFGAVSGYAVNRDFVPTNEGREWEKVLYTLLHHTTLTLTLAFISVWD